MLKKSKLFKIIFLFFIIMLVKPNYAFSEATALGLYPPLIAVKANERAKIETYINLSNFSNNDISVSISFQQLLGKSLGDQNSKLVSNSKDFTEFYTTSISLYDKDKEVNIIDIPAKQSKKIKLTIDNSIKEKKDYYFAITFTQENKEQINSSASFIEGSIGVNILLSLNQKNSPDIIVEGLKSAPFHISTPADFRIQVKNQSQDFKEIYGYLLLRDIFGNPIDRVELMPSFVFPKSAVFMETKVSKTEKRTNNEEVNIIRSKEKNLIGFYTAELHIFDQFNPNKEQVRSNFFFVLPIKIITILTIFSLVIISIYLKVNKKLQK